MTLSLNAWRLAACAAVALLSGCAAPTAKELIGTAIGRPYTPTAEDRAQLPADPNFKLEPAAAGKAVVYVYRNSQWVASLRDYQVWVDDRLAGEVGNGRFIRLELPPGTHAVHAQLAQHVPEKGPADDLNSIQPVPKAMRQVQLEAGQIVVLRLNRGQKHVDTLYGSKGRTVNLLNEVFNLEVVSDADAVFDMSRLKPHAP